MHAYGVAYTIIAWSNATNNAINLQMSSVVSRKNETTKMSIF